MPILLLAKQLKINTQEPKAKFDASMTKSILIWALKVPLLILLSLVAYLIAPFIAMFIVHADETETTGHPSMLPGQPREFLIPLFRIWQSQDAPVDEWWWVGYRT
jgi:hypothetical protein